MKESTYLASSSVNSKRLKSCVSISSIDRFQSTMSVRRKSGRGTRSYVFLVPFWFAFASEIRYRQNFVLRYLTRRSQASLLYSQLAPIVRYVSAQTVPGSAIIVFKLSSVRLVPMLFANGVRTFQLLTPIEPRRKYSGETYPSLPLLV